MAIPVTCGGCRQTFNVRDDWAGRVGKCPSCGARITVPSPGMGAAPAPPPVRPVAPAQPHAGHARPAAPQPTPGPYQAPQPPPPVQPVPPQPQWQQPAAPQGYAPPPQAPQPQWGQQPAAPQGYAPQPQAPQPQWGQQPAAPQGYAPVQQAPAQGWAPQPAAPQGYAPVQQAPQPQWGQQPAAPQGYPPQGYPPQGGQQGYPQGYGVAPATGRRPGGLTALAVLNFVFAGLAALGIILAIANPLFELAARVVGPVLYFMLFLDVAGAALLVLSGIGYLGQKKVLGKVMGTVYGGVVILNFILAVAVVGSFAILGILGIAYAVLTVVLLNTVFRNSFTR